MKKHRIAILSGILIGLGSLSATSLHAMDFSRGDPNDDGSRNIADAIYMVNFLYLDGPTPGCLDAADVNDDGTINVADVIFALSSFAHGAPFPMPVPLPDFCGPDPTPDSLSCVSYSCP